MQQQQQVQQQQHVASEQTGSFLFIPHTTWIALGLFLYILSPLDLIPDILPLIGWLDDAVALVMLLRMVWPGQHR